MNSFKPFERVEARACPDAELRKRIEVSLNSHPQLNTIFRGRIDDLISSKADWNNEAVYYLAAHNEHTLVALDVIEKGLQLFDGEHGIADVKSRLADIHSQASFHSAYTELDLALYYKGREYRVELTPSTKGGESKADLRIKGAFDVTFEARTVWLDEFVRDRRIVDDLKRNLLNFGEFILSLNLQNGFSESDVDPLLEKTRAWLNSLAQNPRDLPQELEYYVEGRSLASIVALHRTEPGKGRVEAESPPAHWTIGAGNLRAKLREKQEQLDSDERNVILLETTFPTQIMDYDVHDALLGDRRVPRGPSRYCIRGPDRFFDPKSGKTSAVLFLRRNRARYGDCERTVFINYFASRSIPSGFFTDARLIQFVEEKAGSLSLKETEFKDYQSF